MKHFIYFPNYVPVPTVGAWVYIVAHAYDQDFHSAGKIIRTGQASEESFVEYQQVKPQVFSQYPL